MQRFPVGTNENFRIRIYLVQLSQAWQDFAELKPRFIKIDVAIGVDGKAYIIALRLRLTRDPAGQVYLDAFHVRLAQAHHHEAGEQKEHDVDQWNDLDPRFLMWNG